ncbi:MAG: ABC transporter permease [Candidatus Acidiferrum sp.]
MTFWSRFRSWARAILQRSRMESEMDAELRFHIEAYAEDLVRGGVPRDEAFRRARLEFGGIEKAKEECREALALRWLNHIWRDIRFGLRMLIKNPGFTVAAVIALALGIGADTAMYTIVNGALTWDLGLDNRDQIVMVRSMDTRRSEVWGVSYPDFRDLRSQVKSLSGLAAYQFLPVNLSDQSALPERYYCAQMSANGFSVVGQRPLLGRDFVVADEQRGAPAVLMLGYHVWRDRYGQDPGIIGKTVRVDEIPRVVIGVMPPGRRFPEDTDLWTPLIPDGATEKRDSRELMLFGRLQDGVGVSKARTEVAALAGRLAAQYPDTNKDISADVRPILEITGVYFMKPLFLALFVAVGFVLLIACADVANMLLGRAAERSREISIRVVIGAGRLPILRQLLLESVVLSLAGGSLGLLVAVGGLRWFDRGTGTVVKPVWLHLSLDLNALSYLAVISIGTGILFGLVPALRLLKTDIGAALKDGGSGVTGSRFGMRASKTLVGIQTALCVVLLTGAGLMIRSAMNLYAAPLGVNPEGVLTMRINLPKAKYAKPESWVAFHEDLEKRLKGLPGMKAAGAASQLPMGSWIPLGVEFEGTHSDALERPEVGGLAVSNNYFEIMQVQARRGRVFLSSDAQAGPPVAVVNETFAKKFWPGEDALGKRVRVVEEESAGPWLIVVGVVPDILQNFRELLKHDPLIYLPFAEKPERQMFLVARTEVPPATMSGAVRRELQQIDANLAVYEVRTLEDRIAESRLTVSLFGGVCTVFAAVATVLAAIGLYAVIMQAVSQRIQEIGLRMALGATRRDILALVFAQGIRPLLPGLVVGLLLAAATSRVLGSLLVGVSPSDPVVFAGTVVVLLAAAVIGCVVPARRATCVDPMVALRYE